MAFEAEKAQAASWGYTWDPTDPMNWRALAGQAQAQQNGWTWNPADPHNWSHIAGQTPGAPSAADGITGVDATPGAADSEIEAKASFSMFASFLAEAGLGELFTYTDGQPGGWAWEMAQRGIDSTAVLEMELEKTPAFQREYGVISAMRARAQAEPGVVIPTMKNVRDYRVAVKSMLKAAGAPPTFYDSNADFDELMKLDLSPVEIEERLGSVRARITQAPPEVRNAFGQLYGAQGDDQLFAFLLDPQHTMDKLERSTKAAYTKGMGTTLGIDVDKALAERIAELPKSESTIYSDLQAVSRMSSLLSESVGEGDDITQNDAIDAQVLGSGAQADRLERRLIERQAVGKGSAGGAATTGTGVVGLG